MGVNIVKFWSRELSALSPRAWPVAEAHLNICEQNGIHLLLTCTWRSRALQEAYYAQGRKLLDEVNALRKKVELAALTPKENMLTVTQAKPGTSKHEIGDAWDVVPIVAGKCRWNDRDLWVRVGSYGIQVGATWLGGIGDKPHFQV